MSAAYNMESQSTKIEDQNVTSCGKTWSLTFSVFSNGAKMQ